MARVVLAMSGGVDSSVAGWLLREQGHDVIGAFMRHGLATECSVEASNTRKQGCCSAADAADARRVADALGIPFYALNFEADFARIVDYFVAQYTAGRTPNPCIVCNTWLKFGKLFEYADSVQADYVATGHYAQLLRDNTPSQAMGKSPPEGGSTSRGEIFALLRGRDPSKDQSYVLFGIERRALARLMFPVGPFHKREIRQMADRIGLRVAGKQDSQEICFVPDRDHTRFVREHRGHTDTSGEIVTTDGRIVGHHAGLERFTIGQRKGLGVAFGESRYVVRLEPETHRVVVGKREELARDDLTAAEVNWLIDPPTNALRCQVKIRYRSRPMPATVQPLGGSRFHATFDEPCYGVAPGQAAVCYADERVLGGGWIE